MLRTCEMVVTDLRCKTVRVCLWVDGGLCAQGYYFCACFYFVEMICPLLHDAASFFKVCGAHVCRHRLAIKKPAKAIRSAGFGGYLRLVETSIWRKL